MAAKDELKKHFYQNKHRTDVLVVRHYSKRFATFNLCQMREKHKELRDKKLN